MQLNIFSQWRCGILYVSESVVSLTSKDLNAELYVRFLKCVSKFENSLSCDCKIYETLSENLSNKNKTIERGFYERRRWIRCFH